MLNSALRLLFVTLTLSSASLAQLDAKRATLWYPTAKGSVTGKISAPGLVDAAGVLVKLRGASEYSQKTGPDGSFVFYDVPAGTYSLIADDSTVPQKYVVTKSQSVEVLPGRRSEAAITLEARRSIICRTFIDVNGDGTFTPGKDVVVEGAQVSLRGRFAVSGADGTFRFDEVPAGRVSLVVVWPTKDLTTQVVLDLGDGPVTDRIVNIPQYR